MMGGQPKSTISAPTSADGWVLVPREPTFDMVSKMGAVVWPDLATSERHETLIEAYRAMLPTTPADGLLPGQAGPSTAHMPNHPVSTGKDGE